MTNRERFLEWYKQEIGTHEDAQRCRPFAWAAWQAACPKGWQCVPVELIDWVKGAQELMREMPGDWPATANQADMLLSAAPKPED